MKLTFVVSGKVQGVMFRQTIMRAALKRGLKAGATNLTSGDEVRVSLEGDENSIQDMVNKLNQNQKINSWDATPHTLKIEKDFLEISKHEVTTENVDSFNWSSGVEFYL